MNTIVIAKENEKMGIVNFRDLGGISAKYGRVKKHRLLRAGELVGLEPADIEMLTGEYQLKSIFDFRDQREIAKRPDMVLPGVQYLNIDIMKDIRENATSLDNVKANLNPQIAADGMREVYRRIVLNAVSRNAYHEFIVNLRELKEGAALFHCFAGKDRTGIGAAIILTILGVSREDIYADYMLTNELRAEANEALIARDRQSGLSESQILGLRHLYTVHESYLDEMYQAAEETYGSFEYYIGEGLGISQQDAELLRTQYLE